MRTNRVYVRRTKKGKLIRRAQEHYLRDDIWCGSHLCSDCGPYEEQKPCLPAASKFYAVLDTNIVLNQIDLLEHPLFGQSVDLILLQTVITETRHQNKRIYARIKTIVEDPSRNCYVFDNEHHRTTYLHDKDSNEVINDKNDRAIRVACNWFHVHLNSNSRQKQVPIILITEDKENLRKAISEGLTAITTEDFVKGHLKQHPELVDIVAKPGEGGANTKFFKYYPPAQIEQGLREGRYLRGKIKVVAYGNFKLAKIFGKESEILIEGDHINRAIEGDEVAVELVTKSAAVTKMDVSGDDVPESKSKTPEQFGRVVGIVERNWRPYCGSLEETDQSSGAVLFVPVDHRIPKIRIRTQVVQDLMDKRIVVNVDGWDVKSMYPDGHFVKTLGIIGDRDTETAVILMEYDIPTEEWSDAVLECLPPDDTLPEDEIKRRVDLRHIPVFSVDPPGCKDIDDALHIRKLPNGLYEVGVHIADVAHYVKPETALDDVGAHRGTSVYLVERRIDMLPALLSTNVCSLVAKRDRFTFSVVWEMNDKAEIQHTRFHRSVIRSVSAFAYSEAQNRIEGKINDEHTERVVNMNNLAKLMKARRLIAGALTLASPAVKFKLDEETEEPTEVGLYQTKEAHSMIEEFMLLANITVAKKILEHYPTFALLRRHPPPTASGFQKLIKVTKARGFEMDLSSSKKFGESLDKCEIEGFPFFNTIIRTIATRCMMQALYFSAGDHEPKDFHHYGLAAPIYTHFTSPIRRYADVIVHRLLASAIGIAPLHDSVKDREGMRNIAEDINHRHRMAQRAGRSSVDLYTLVYFKERACKGEEAVISEIRTNGISVIVPKFGITHKIDLVSPSDVKTGQNPFAYDDDELSLTRTQHPPIKLQIFDRVKVNIFVETSKMHRSKLVVQLDDERIIPPKRTKRKRNTPQSQETSNPKRQKSNSPPSSQVSEPNPKRVKSVD